MDFPFKVTFPGLKTMLKLNFGNLRPQDPKSVLNVTFPGFPGFEAINKENFLYKKHTKYKTDH